MPITLVSGRPGAGKTLNTIQQVEKEWGDSERPIYYVGIRDLKLDWNELQYEDIHNWEEYPHGSIFVIDEADLAFPARPHSKQVPSFIQELARHRHKGMDFYVITQKPTMVDHGVRAHVTEHIHYERRFGMDRSTRFIWNKAVDPDDYHSRQEVQSKKNIKFDSKAFGLYHSAEVHTVRKSVPGRVWAVAALFLAIAGYGAFFLMSVNSEPAYAIEESNSTDLKSLPEPIRREGRVYLTGDDLEADDAYLDQWQPRVKDVPYSAPAFDGLTEVKTYPRPQCMHDIRRNLCRCYTQQATPLDISYGACMKMIEGGWFNPFREENVQGGGAAGAGELASRASSDTPVKGDRSHEYLPPESGYIPPVDPQSTYPL